MAVSCVWQLLLGVQRGQEKRTRPGARVGGPRPARWDGPFALRLSAPPQRLPGSRGRRRADAHCGHPTSVRAVSVEPVQGTGNEGRLRLGPGCQGRHTAERRQRPERGLGQERRFRVKTEDVRMKRGRLSAVTRVRYL